MHVKNIAITAVCLLAVAVSYASDLSDKLKSPDYVLLMRHTLAPGVGDPVGYTLQDCQTQRNLSDEGRQQAQRVGQWLKQQGIHTAELHTSAWCRCKDTATLLNLGNVTVEPSLASFFDDMRLASGKTQALQNFIARQLKTKGDKALILVTHHVNIHAFMGENIGSGDLVLAKVNASGKMTTYKVIPRPQ